MSKIAILSRFQNRVQRGAETFVYELSGRLKKKNQVDILTGSESDSLTKILLGKYDIVISMNGGFQSLKASIGRIFSPYKLVIVGEAGIGRIAIWNTAVVQPDVFVAVTDYMAEWVKRWAWNSRVVKINNGVDLNKFTPTGSKVNLGLPKPIILTVGALVWYKYHDKVIRAVGEAGGGSLLIVGRGPEKDKLEKIGRKLLGDRFKIVNFNYEDMPKIYRSCNLFTLPSWDREAFGIVYIEAMASNLPVVAPDDSPRREIVGEAGILTQVGDSKKYAKAITDCLNTIWDDKPRKQAEKFSWEIQAEKYQHLIDDKMNT